MNTQRKSEHNPEANDPQELNDANLRGELAWMLKVLREESEDWSPAGATMFGMYLDSLYDESKRRGHEPLNACAVFEWGDKPENERWVFGKPGGWPLSSASVWHQPRGMEKTR